MTETHEVDWRIEDVGTVAKDSRELNAGARILLISMAKHRKYKTLSFVTPSATALALSVAINAAAMAESLRPRLATVEVITPSGKRGFQIRNDCTSDRYT